MSFKFLRLTSRVSSSFQVTVDALTVSLNIEQIHRSIRVSDWRLDRIEKETPGSCRENETLDLVENRHSIRLKRDTRSKRHSIRLKRDTRSKRHSIEKRQWILTNALHRDDLLNDGDSFS